MHNVVAFSARVLDPKDKPKYLNSSEHAAFEKSKILYGLHIVKKHIKEFNYMIVVEGQMDVIALHQLGYPIAVATCGTAVTAEHIKLIKRYTDNAYFLFDNDDAGQKATLRALKIAYQHDMFPKLIDLPSRYKDVDELAQENDGKAKFQSYLE
jgi:DNA primase